MPAPLQAGAGLLAPKDLALLRRLQLLHSRPAGGLYPGRRRSARSARSPELADFRPYAPGDDVRQIDWRAYGRLERLVLRLYVAEEEAALNVVVDASESMTVGRPPKWPATCRLAAALAMLGLTAMDRVTVGTLDKSRRQTPQMRLSGGPRQILAFLDQIQPGGRGGPDDLLALSWLKPGLTVIVSDFMGEDDWAPALAALARARQDMVLWQVLAPDEESPELAGDVQLVDVETGAKREITITHRVLQVYLRNLAEHRRQLARKASAAGGRFLHSRSDWDLKGFMADGLRSGVVTRT